MTDNELAIGGSATAKTDLVRFLRSTGTLIPDSTHFEHERASRVGWGHSSARDTVDLALEAGVPRLILFPTTRDLPTGDLDRLLDEARERAETLGGKIAIELAIEGKAVFC